MRYFYFEVCIIPTSDGTWQAAEMVDGNLPALAPAADTVWGYGATPQKAIAALMEAVADEDWTVESESETSE